MSHAESLPQVYLARHGGTEWTITRQHTGRSDIPLTPAGEQEARWLIRRLSQCTFDQVLTSPLVRARRTAALAGFSQAISDPDVMEWDYGRYDGLTTAEIKQDNPAWLLFRDGCPGGESVAEAAARADRVVARLRQAGGRILIFSHGHFLRLLAARWLGMPALCGQSFVLDTASLSILGYEHTRDEPVIRLWNEVDRR
jgi:broad specificity phosphatase PhoE